MILLKHQGNFAHDKFLKTDDCIVDEVTSFPKEKYRFADMPCAAIILYINDDAKQRKAYLAKVIEGDL